MIPATHAQRSLSAEARLVESGRRAFVQSDGSILVKSDSEYGVNRRVTFFGDGTGIVRWTCDCPFGEHNPNLAYAGCRHIAAAARATEWRGLTTWVNGQWIVPVPTHETTIRTHAEGAPSNFEVSCTCGTVHNVASTDMAFAVQVAERHVKAHQPASIDEVFGMLSGGPRDLL